MFPITFTHPWHAAVAFIVLCAVVFYVVARFEAATLFSSDKYAAYSDKELRQKVHMKALKGTAVLTVVLSIIMAIMLLF